MAVAQARLLEAVIDARAVGDPWIMIGISLGVSRQAAEQRFGKRVREALAARGVPDTVDEF